MVAGGRIPKSKLLNVMQLRLKSKYALAENIEEILEKKLLQHKQHPGVVAPRVPTPPKSISDAIRALVKGSALSSKQIRRNAEKLAACLHARHKPLEEEEIGKKLEIARARLAGVPQSKTAVAIDPLSSKRGKRLIKQLVYNWQPIRYDESASQAYLVGRAIPNYTVLYKIFNEMKHREPTFKPYTILDFGSGVGTVLWAANEIWGNSLQEHICIDVSSEMHDLSDRLIRTAGLKIKRVFYRQHVPASPMPKYDIVTSAYSLFELPSATARLELLSNLWKKTDRYLVLVEEGTNAAFKILNEARDFILESSAQGEHRPEEAAHVSAPCPHNLACPRYTSDNTPCNFSTSYLPLPILTPSTTRDELYSYVVLRKGRIAKEEDEQWPRIVRPVLKRSRHVICRMCTGRGQLEEEIFTTWISGKNAYRCARSSSWGDRLPVKLVDRVTPPENAVQSEEKDLTERESIADEEKKADDRR